MPNIYLDDTIAAIATPPGESGIAIIRLSGPESVAIAGKIFEARSGNVSDFDSHTIHYGRIRNEDGKTVDQVYLSLFRSPKSYTGQDVVEISSHGGLVVSRVILNRLIQSGARHAEPGEFTKRAFLNGKIDLVQAEAVIDLIKARSEKSAEIALHQLGGALGAKFQSLKNEILKMMAHIEAFLDFPEEHLEVYSDKEFAQKFDQIQAEIHKLLAGFERGSLLREGVCVVLAGRPNVGKSSLFNALLERDRALVSEHPGTTRDTLEEAIELEGLYLRLIDTAGITDTQNPVERLGIERTQQFLKQAQLILYIADSSAAFELQDHTILEQVRQSGKPFLICLNKWDLVPKDVILSEAKDLARFSAKQPFRAGLWPQNDAEAKADVLRLSAKTREGFEALEKKIVEKILAVTPAAESEQITRLRHKNALDECGRALDLAKKSFRERQSLEFMAADLKAALDSVRELVGEIYSEDLLDVIFSEFCIGK